MRTTGRLDSYGAGKLPAAWWFPIPRGVENKCGNNQTKAWESVKGRFYALVDKNHGQILLWAESVYYFTDEISWITTVKNGKYKNEGGDCRWPGEKKHTPIDQLLDIRDVKIDSSLPTEERIKSFVEQIKDPYQFKVGSTVVRVAFANTQNTITDNFINMVASM